MQPWRGARAPNSCLDSGRVGFRVKAMKTILVAGLALGLLVVGCGKKGTPPSPPATNAAAAWGNPLDAPANYLGGLAQAQKLAVKVVDQAGVNHAIEMFNLAEGRNPKDLKELVPNYMPRLPEVPYGMKFEYNPTTGKFRVVRAAP
jgi:hypothetical protein